MTGAMGSIPDRGMAETHPRTGKVQYITTVVLFLVFGGIIGAAGYVSFIPRDISMVLKTGMAIASLAAWLVLGRIERLRQYRPIVFGFFAVSVGLLLARYLSNVPMQLMGLSVTSVRGVAMAKFGEALPIVLCILVAHFATGGTLDDLFLRRGKLKLWLPVSVIGAAAFVGIGALQAAGSGLSWSTVVRALPWIAIFTFSNAFMEELWFRALFLKKLEPLVGTKTSLVITTLIFALVHISATYVIDILLFLVAVTALALLWGWLMQKSNSIWGAVLIHAAGDILGIVGYLAQVGL